MSVTYTTKEAAELSGASRQALRAYTRRYARYFSTEATPEHGQDRRYTLGDLKLVAYIYGQTSAGASHDQVIEKLTAGALDNFEWALPGEDAEEATSQSSTALVPVERLQAAHALLQDAQRREEEAAARADALQAEIQRLTLELGKAQGEAAAIKSSRHRAPRWWRAVFGGSEE